MADIRNWGPRNALTRRGTRILRPGNQDELATMLRSGAYRKVRAVGSAHSFNDIATVADGDRAAVVLIDRLDRIVAVNVPDNVHPVKPASPMPATVGTVTVEGGITLDRLLADLLDRGLTLVNIGAIREQTVAGAISTGTHGASIHVGSLSSLVVSLKLLRADGEVVTLSRHDAEPDMFRCAAVGLGALGILLEVELEVVRAFAVRPVSRMLTAAEFMIEGRALAEAHPYARFYYFPYTDSVECVTDIPVSGPAPTPGIGDQATTWIRGSVVERHVAENLLTVCSSIVPQVSVPLLMRTFAAARRTGEGSVDWSHRCLSLRDLPPRHVEMEWSVPLEHWQATFKALHDLVRSGPQFVAGFVVSLRFVGSDDRIALSNNFERANLAIDIMQFHRLDPSPYFTAAAAVIRQAAEGEARPHWGKVFESPRAELATLYPDLPVFESIRRKLDPDNVFTNSYLERVLDV